MLEPRPARMTVNPNRFDPKKARIDPAVAATFQRNRVANIAKLLGKQVPYDLKTPWLTLRPDHPTVAGKGWVEYTSPGFVGMGQFDDGDYMYAGFDLIFQKQEPGSYSIERPQLAIRLTSPPKPKMLLEIDIFAHDQPSTDPVFDVYAAQHQTVTVPDAQRQTLMFVMYDFFSIQSAWAEGKNFFDRDGNWAFFEARITALD